VDVTGGLITTGNVGIGTSSPTAKVTLGGSGDQYINRAVEDGSIILSGGQGVYGGYTSGGFIARGSTSTYNQSGIELYTGGAERMRITTDKVQFNVDAKVDVDNAHDLGSGGARWKDLYLSGGVIFGATGGTVTSKTLDDYEEGTWTPAYSTSGGSFAYDSATQGQYTKIGNMVTVYFRIYTTSATVGTGNVSITGLPFAEAFTNGTLGGSIGDCRLFAGDTPSEIGVYNSELLLWYRTSANGANTRLQASDLGTGFIDNLIDGQITYVTS
jgi:hypothetical protein